MVMKYRIKKFGSYSILLLLIVGVSACSDSWLEPKPLSFYTPENTYVDADGFYAAITACERNMRHEFFGDGSPILTEFILSDMVVEGTTDKAGPQMDLDVALLPDAQLNHENNTRVGWYWYEGYKIGRATSELQSRGHLVCRLLLEKKNKKRYIVYYTKSMV